MRILEIEIMTLLLLATCGLADVRRVPSEYPTIQAAIDGAYDGDTVLVAPGTYTGQGNRDIEFKGKAITVKSEAGPQTCIIDCQGTWDEPHSGFYFHNDEDTNSVLKGMTIMNAGGFSGIYCFKANPIIAECVLTENSSSGISCYKSNPFISDCIITENRSPGITCVASNPVVKRCHISYNYSAEFGGGISIRPESTHPYNYSMPTLINCTITGNNSDYGGGVYCQTSSVDLFNCTVSGNRAREWGGGICLHQARSANINSCILYENIAPTGREFLVSYVVGHENPPDHPLYSITHSAVGSDPNAIVNMSYPNLISGQWIHVDPLFADPGYWDANGTPDDPNDDIWVDGDYHLKSQAGRWDSNSQTWVQDDVTSPCIDTGDPNSPIGHEPFPNGGIINMGAYGGTAEASKSYFGEPVCETIIAGDINGDCKVDFMDFTLIATHWLEDNTP